MVLGAMSLPFVSAPHRSAMALDALPTLLLIAPVFAITLIPDHTRPLPRPVAWASLVLGMTALPYAVIKYLDAAVLADTLGGRVGVGARVLVFGAFVVIVGIALGLTRSWLGLATGGNPVRRTAIRTTPGPPAAPHRAAPAAPTGSPDPAPPTPRPSPVPPEQPVRPTRARAEQSPFGDPLFDSLEVPATRADEVAPSQPGLVFDIDGAAERRGDDTPEA